MADEKNKNNEQNIYFQGSEVRVGITHHLDVRVLSKQAVIGHGLKERGAQVRSKVFSLT